jgi:hypothetical protein
MIGFAVSIFFSFIILGAAVFDLKNLINFQPDFAKFGAVGDFLGGILNPILAFLVLLVLLGTTRLQKEELNETRKELHETTKAAQQANIENAFFQLFNLLQQNLQTVHVEAEGNVGETKTYTGAKGFEIISREILKGVNRECSEVPAHEHYVGNPDDLCPNGWKEILAEHPDAFTAKREVLLGNYRYVYNKYQADLGRYFRLLHNVLKFLSEKEESIPKEMYETYYKIVRASLSNYELFMIMVNGLTKAGQPMKKYISQFELFDNLPKSIHIVSIYDDYGNDVDRLDLTELWSEFDEKSFGDNVDFIKN